MTKLTKDEAFAILSEELATVVNTGEKDSNGDNVREVFRGVPVNWHPDVLRRALRIAAGRFHGQFLASIPTEDGAKVKAFRPLWESINAGEIPPELKGGSRATTGKLDDLESIIVELATDRLLVAAEAMDVEATGKNGRVLKADLMAALAAHPKTKGLVRAVGEGYAFDTDAILASGLAETVRADAEAELAKRQERAEEAKGAKADDMLKGLGL